MKPSLSYQDISLVPRNLSQVNSRQEIDLSLNLESNGVSYNLRLPVFPAPMDTICSLEMCQILSNNGMLGMIHRFQPIDKRKESFKSLKNDGFDAAIAVGLDEKEIINEFYNSGARAFIVDVANGFNTAVEPTIKQILDFKNTYIICGNVDSEEGFKYLSDLGVDAIRVGIGSGSMCTTSIMTGVGQGIVSSIQECRGIKEKIGSKSLIIADGGIRAVGDIAKALTVGADAVMVGRMLAGTKEAEGNILKYNGKLYKAYRGSASYAVQQKRGKNPYYVEGDETIVEYKGGVQNILDQIDAGLRSSMSYMAANNLNELKKNGSYVIKHNVS
ncbi:guanosine monophosphate reductase [bacterium]|nr:guanosine monophosphate reductase [bacterium]